jgi:hypothetical protein
VTIFFPLTIFVEVEVERKLPPPVGPPKLVLENWENLPHSNSTKQSTPHVWTQQQHKTINTKQSTPHIWTQQQHKTINTSCLDTATAQNNQHLMSGHSNSTKQSIPHVWKNKRLFCEGKKHILIAT